jgi:ferredoxin
MSMYERYHIPLKTIEGRAQKVPKFVITRSDGCINCGRCERACIYGVHKRSEADPRDMADPLSHLCKNCFRCVAECPQRALTMSQGKEYMSLGRGLWTPLRISTIWGEAETGKIPVLGAGYRGKFAGAYYDAMWTDMSEIVRPTRDGIHGRESISTSVDIGRIPLSLEFDPSGEQLVEMPPLMDIPIPMVMDLSSIRNTGGEFIRGCVLAAVHLNTLVIAPHGSVPDELVSQLGPRYVPVCGDHGVFDGVDIPAETMLVEAEATPEWRETLKAFGDKYPDKILSFRIRARPGMEAEVVDMLREGVASVHIAYDEQGMERGDGGLRHARDSLRRVHSSLIAEGRRDEITIFTSGGIAAAEHVPKSIVCGADIVALNRALLVALECRLCLTCSPGSCPVSIEAAPAEWVEGRITNMVGAWRDQMLEMLGAMGLREVRRLRGEVGRAIFFEDIERDFRSLLTGGEGDG